MPALDPCFSGVATRAKRLKVARLIGQLGVRPDGLDVIHFQAPAAAAGTATIAIAFEDFGAQHLPAFGAGDALGIAVMIAANAH